MYITLKKALFKRGNKTADRNMLVTVSVRDQKGIEVQGAISRGTGKCLDFLLRHVTTK